MPQTNQLASRLPRAPILVASLCACIMLIIGTAVSPPSSPIAGASWIWHPEAASDPDCRVYLATTVTLPGRPLEAMFVCTADNEYVLFVNGRKAGSSPGPGHSGEWWRRLDEHDVTKLLKTGTNVLAVEAHNGSGPAGFIGGLDIRLPDGKSLSIVTDDSWSASLDPPADWPRAPAMPFGKPAANLGTPPVSPWGNPAPPSHLAGIIGELRTDMARELVLPQRIVEVRGCQKALRNASNIMKADGRTARIELPAGREVAVVLDFGREVVGHFRAETSGGSAALDLAYGESLQECLQDKPFQPIERRDAGPGRWKWVDPERRALVGVPAEAGTTRVWLDDSIVWDGGKTARASPAKVSAMWSDDRFVYLKLPSGGRYRVRAISSAH